MHPPVPSVALGVRHNPDPFTPVERPHIAGPNILPFRVIPDFGKGSEDLVKSSKSKGSDVFHEREVRSYFANKPGIFKPEPRSAPVQPKAFASD
jgi:hypothetical protein